MRRPAGAIHSIAYLLVLVGAVATGVLGWVPAEVLAPRVGFLSPDGGIEGLASSIGPRARVISLLLAALAAFLWLLRLPLRQRLEDAMDDLAGWLGTGIRKARGALAAGDPAAWSLVLIVLAGAALRGAHLAEPVEYDEAWTVIEWISQPLHVGLTQQREANNHVFHTLLARPFYLLGGYRMAAIRIPVFLAGVFLIPMVFLLGRAMGGTAVGLWSAALTVGAGPVLLYSVRARGYAFLALAFATLIVTGYRLLREPSPGAWLLFVVASALGAFSIPAMLYPFLVAVLWMTVSALVRPPQRGRVFFGELIRACAATGVLTLLLYAPFLLASGPLALLRPPFAAPVSTAEFLGHWASFQTWTSLVGFLADPLPAAVASLLGLAVVVGMLSSIRGNSPLPPALGIVVLPILVGIQHVLPPDRVWTFLSPLLVATACLGGAWVVSYLPTPRMPTRRMAALASCLGAVALASMIQWRSDFFHRARYLSGFDRPSEVAACLERHLGPEDGLLVKGVLYWPARFLIAANELPDSWTTAHRQEDFSGRLWALSAHDPLAVAVAEEIRDGRTRPGLMSYVRDVEVCGNATLHQMAPTPAAGDWRPVPGVTPARPAPG